MSAEGTKPHISMTSFPIPIEVWCRRQWISQVFAELPLLSFIVWSRIETEVFIVFCLMSSAPGVSLQINPQGIGVGQAVG